MTMVDTLRRSGGIDAIAAELQLNPAVIAAGAAALIPMVQGGFLKPVRHPERREAELAGVLAMLEPLGGSSLATAVLEPGVTDPAPGNIILAAIFGGKPVSRRVATWGTQRSGIDAGVLERMLPLIAMLLGGYLSAKAGGADRPATSSAGLAAMLKLDASENPLDMLLDQMGKQGE